MLLHAMGREAMSRQLGKVWTKRQMDAARAEGRAIEVPPEPLPLGTTDDYIRRVKDRWEANPLPDRLQSRDRARRRILGQILDRASKDDHDGVAKRESILVKIEGTEVPKTLEISGPGGAPVAFRGADEILPMLEKLAGKKD
jgi:hypothetical protein